MSINLTGHGTRTGEICPKCGMDDWAFIDNPTEYTKICVGCANNGDLTTTTYKKQDYVDNFECPDCGGLNGTLEENRTKLGVRCANCGKLTIMLLKNSSATDNRHLATKNEPKCPKCGSTSITTGARGVNLMWGLIGASKTVNRCASCGHTWKPKR